MKMFSLAVPTVMLGATDMALGERVAYAATLTLLGMMIIFVVLATVWLAITVMRWILNFDVKKKTAKSSVTKVVDPDVQRDPVEAAPVVVAAEDNAAVLAAITAAIAVVWESEHPGTGFRVVSYRHVDKFSAWNTKR